MKIFAPAEQLCVRIPLIKLCSYSKFFSKHTSHGRWLKTGNDFRSVGFQFMSGFKGFILGEWFQHIFVKSFTGGTVFHLGIFGRSQIWIIHSLILLIFVVINSWPKMCKKVNFQSKNTSCFFYILQTKCIFGSFWLFLPMSKNVFWVRCTITYLKDKNQRFLRFFITHPGVPFTPPLEKISKNVNFSLWASKFEAKRDFFRYFLTHWSVWLFSKAEILSLNCKFSKIILSNSDSNSVSKWFTLVLLFVEDRGEYFHLKAVICITEY